MKSLFLSTVVLGSVLCGGAFAQDPGPGGNGSPGDLQRLMSQAVEHAKKGDYAAAEKICDQVLQKWPKVVGVYVFRASMREKQGNEKEALEDYFKAISLAPNSPQVADAYEALGLMHLRKGKYQKAVDEFSKELDINPNASSAWAFRAEAYAGLGEFDKALEDAKGAIYYDAVGGHLARGRIEVKMGNYDAALSDYGEALKNAPQDASVLSDRALLYYGLGKYREAAADYLKALGLDSSDPDYWQFFLYLSRARSGDAKAAREDLSKYAAQRKSKGKDDWALQVLDFLCGKSSQENLLKAANSAQDVGKIRDRTCEATFYAAQVLLMQKKTDEATALLRECLATNVRNFMEWQVANQEMSRLAPAHDKKSAPNDNPPSPQK